MRAWAIDGQRGRPVRHWNTCTIILEWDVDDVEPGSLLSGVIEDTGSSWDSHDSTANVAQASVAMEAILFAAGEPLSSERLAALLELSEDAMQEAVRRLALELRGRGIRLVRHGDDLELATSPDFAPLVRKLTDETRKVKLSHAALETLAIVAYRQPVTRAQIETVRGVSSDRSLSTLVSHDLIEDAGRLDTAGRPVQYRTTLAFLERFGLGSLEELPPLGPGTVEPVKQGKAGGADVQAPPPRAELLDD